MSSFLWISIDTTNEHTIFSLFSCFRAVLTLFQLYRIHPKSELLEIHLFCLSLRENSKKYTEKNHFITSYRERENAEIIIKLQPMRCTNAPMKDRKKYFGFAQIASMCHCPQNDGELILSVPIVQRGHVVDGATFDFDHLYL